MDSLWIDPYKIRVNLPRFPRLSFKEPQRRDPHYSVTNPSPREKNIIDAEITEKGTILRRKKSKEEHTSKDGNSKNNGILVYEERGEDNQWLKGAVVGKAKFYEDWIKAMWETKELGFDSIKISPMNEGLWLVFDEEKSKMDLFMKDAKEWLNEWFDEWQPWKESNGVNE